MNNRYKKAFILVTILACASFGLLNLQAQTFKVATGSGGGSATSVNVIGVYVYSGTLAPDNKAYYTKISGNSSPSYCFYINGFWDISAVLGDDGSTNLYYYNTSGVASSGLTFPVGDYGLTWSADYGQVPTTNAPITSQNSTANMTFSNGSGFTPPSGTPGTNNNVIGRFQLTGNAEGGVLQTLVVSLTGTRSGVNNVKLWSSTDDTFSSGTDTQLSSKSDASSVTFNSFNSLVDNSSGTYYFITVDLTAGATGNVTVTIPSQASFTFAGANNPSSFTNAALSSGSVPLPVELTSFTVSEKSGEVSLNWRTATEVNNYGFEVERRSVSSQSSSVNSWQKIAFVAGNGTSNIAHEYFYSDTKLVAGRYSYRLKQIDNDGTFKYSQNAEIEIVAPKEFSLAQNYPNPFNPSTTISFSIASPGYTSLRVFDIMGREVATLVNESKEIGSYEVKFDASKLASGIYFYKLSSGNYSVMKKLMLLK